MKFHSNPIAEHAEAPLADGGRWEDLIARWAERHASEAESSVSGSACYVVSVARAKAPAENEGQLAEIVGLVQAQGDRVAGREIQVLRRIEPRTLLGKGA